MVASFSDSVAVALSTATEVAGQGLDLVLWATRSRHGEVGDLVIDITGRLGGVPHLVELASARDGDLGDLIDPANRGRLGPAPGEGRRPTLIVDGVQVGRGRAWSRMREFLDDPGSGPVVVILDSERHLPLALSGHFVHLELSDAEALRDPRLLHPRAPLNLDLRQADRTLATWTAVHERMLAAIDLFRDERWSDAYDEGRVFSRISRHAVPRPWTYRLAARAATAAALWGVAPERLLRGCVGPRIGGLLAAALDQEVRAARELPSPSEGSAG